MNMSKREQFIEKAKKIHYNENIDYSEVVYINNRTPVKLFDHDLKDDGTEYGEFWQTPYNHLRGQSHPLKKGQKISLKKRDNTENIIKRFKEVHKNENLDYSQVKYINMHTKVKIISHDLRPDGTEYGEFWQEPVVHLKGCTHPDIGKQKQILKQTLTNEEFIQKSKDVHSKDDYTYECVNYVNNRTKVQINCHKKNVKGEEHGIFSISPDNFLQGKGCPKCGNHLSIGEEEIVSFLKTFYTKPIICREHSILNGKELDIYLPDDKIAFEFNGLRWHSELYNKDKNYHFTKMNECKTLGIRLFHIFEDEFINSKSVLLSKIKKILNNNDEIVKIGARKCIIREITNEQAKDFLIKNHIQGFAKSTLYIGGFYNDKLVGVMTFTKENDDDWILVRSANDIGYQVQGLSSKLFLYFIRKYKAKAVKTFLDRRWEIDMNNNVYTKIGFKLDGIIKPDYRYTNGHGERIHKFNFRKQVLLRKYPNSGLSSDMTEKEMATKLGYYRIWDCGLIRYVYKNLNHKDD